MPLFEHNITEEFRRTGTVDLDALDPRGRYFNAGVFCFKPDLGELENMMQAVETWDDSRTPFAEQDFLNALYSGRWDPLPYVYNTLKTWAHAHPQIFDLGKIKVLHYIRTKPWQDDPANQPYEQLNKLWWDMRNWSFDGRLSSRRPRVNVRTYLHVFSCPPSKDATSY